MNRVLSLTILLFLMISLQAKKNPLDFGQESGPSTSGSSEAAAGSSGSTTDSSSSGASAGTSTDPTKDSGSSGASADPAATEAASNSGSEGANTDSGAAATGAASDSGSEGTTTDSATATGAASDSGSEGTATESGSQGATTDSGAAGTGTTTDDSVDNSGNNGGVFPNCDGDECIYYSSAGPSEGASGDGASPAEVSNNQGSGESSNEGSVENSNEGSNSSGSGDGTDLGTTNEGSNENSGENRNGEGSSASNQGSGENSNEGSNSSGSGEGTSDGATSEGSGEGSNGSSGENPNNDGTVGETSNEGSNGSNESGSGAENSNTCSIVGQATECQKAHLLNRQLNLALKANNTRSVQSDGFLGHQHCESDVFVDELNSPEWQTWCVAGDHHSGWVIQNQVNYFYLAVSKQGKVITSSKKFIWEIAPVEYTDPWSFVGYVQFIYRECDGLMALTTNTQDWSDVNVSLEPLRDATDYHLPSQQWNIHLA